MIQIMKKQSEEENFQNVQRLHKVLEDFHDYSKNYVCLWHSLNSCENKRIFTAAELCSTSASLPWLEQAKKELIFCENGMIFFIF